MPVLLKALNLFLFVRVKVKDNERENYDDLNQLRFPVSVNGSSDGISVMDLSTFELVSGSGGIIGGQNLVAFGAVPPKTSSSYDGWIFVCSISGLVYSENTCF